MATTENNRFVPASDQVDRLKKHREPNQENGVQHGKLNPKSNGFHNSGNLHSSSQNVEEQCVLGDEMDWSGYDLNAGEFEKSSLLTAALTHIGLYIIMFLGFINQLLFKPNVATEKNREGYAPLYHPFDQLFSRYVYRRVRHCFNRPICSAPGAQILLRERISDDYNWTFRLTERLLPCINLGSYNYLGFAEGSAGGVAGGAGEGAGGAGDAGGGPGIAAQVEAETRRWGLALCSARAELGSTELHRELERTTADFFGVEDAIVVGMGFATNALLLPGLVSRQDLVLSDAKNHASLILGLRLAAVCVRLFPHNDLRALERLARAARAERRWRKIVVVVEGIYSMEGSIVPLAALVALKRRLGLALYLDEAHSVGALGGSGRGASQLAGVPAGDVDVLMGTFTKSFGAAGGYIAGSRELINNIRLHGHAHWYAHSMAPPVAAQVLAAMRALQGASGQLRLRALRDNTRYFRSRLAAMGCVVYGHAESPVVPLLVYSFSKMAATVERLLARGVAVVGVGFPATPLNKARIRFCLSAAHSREQLDACLAAIQHVVTELGLDYSRRPRPLL